MTKSTSTVPEQCLDDLLVLELGDEGTQYCGQLLADMGARVLKIEPPKGAGARHRGPFKDDKPDPNCSLYFWAYNTNKESLTLDLSAEADRRKLKRLAQKADIILEDFSPGYLETLGLGYDQLSATNPGLIMTSVTPFGQTGPLKDWKGSDLVYWAMGGILAGGGYSDASTPPLAAQAELSYLAAGHWSFVGTLMALAGRDISGEGQQVDTSIHEACSYVNRGSITSFPIQFDAKVAPSRGSAANTSIRCKDGKYFIPQMTFTNPTHWGRLVEWLKEEGVARPSWDEDLKRLTEEKAVTQFMAPLEGIMEAIGEVAARMTVEEICPIGQKMGLTWMVFNAPDELVEDEQLKYRGFFQEVQHPEHNTSYTYAGEPYRFSKAGWKIRRRPPLLGEDNSRLNELIGGRHG